MMSEDEDDGMLGRVEDDDGMLSGVEGADGPGTASGCVPRWACVPLAFTGIKGIIF
jgi:hypothetical protein